MLRPTGNFGKFLTVMLSLGVVGNMAASLYSISLNIQIFIPWLVIVPRYVCSLLAAAVYVVQHILLVRYDTNRACVPSYSIVSLSIVGSHRFYDTLTNFLGLIGYWASSFGAIILVEHFLFRQNNFTSYDLQIWNNSGRLPTGIAALGAGIASVTIIVPSIDQVWFVGPIAKVTGDIGFEVAFLVSGVLYVPFRWIESRLRKAVWSFLGLGSELSNSNKIEPFPPEINWTLGRWLNSLTFHSTSKYNYVSRNLDACNSIPKCYHGGARDIDFDSASNWCDNRLIISYVLEQLLRLATMSFAYAEVYAFQPDVYPLETTSNDFMRSTVMCGSPPFLRFLYYTFSPIRTTRYLAYPSSDTRTTRDLRLSELS